MVQQCAACGFAADTTITLPEEWVAYLIEERGFEDIAEDTEFPMCIGCQQTVETLSDPRHPNGGMRPDMATRAFLDDISQHKQRM